MITGNSYMNLIKNPKSQVVAMQFIKNENQFDWAQMTRNCIWKRNEQYSPLASWLSIDINTLDEACTSPAFYYFWLSFLRQRPVQGKLKWKIYWSINAIFHHSWPIDVCSCGNCVDMEFHNWTTMWFVTQQILCAMK